MKNCKTSFTFLLILCAYCITSGQDRVDALQYFTYVNQAHRNVYKGSYEKALNNYKGAFHRTAQTPFFIDYRNAIVLAQNLNEEETLVQLVKHIVVDKSADQKVLEFLLPQTATYQFVWDSIQVFQQQKCAYNKAYRKEIEALYESHVALHKMMTKPTTKRNKIIIDNLDQFEFLIEKWGFPTENKIGVGYGQYSYDNMLGTILRHFMQFGFRPNELHDITLFDRIYPILHGAVLNGDLHPSLFATLMEQGKQLIDRSTRCPFDYQNTFALDVDNQTYEPFISYTPDNFTCVTDNRLFIGLDSLHIARQYLFCDAYRPQKNCELSYVFDPYIVIITLTADMFETNEKVLEQHEILNIDTRKCPCLIDQIKNN